MEQRKERDEEKRQLKCGNEESSMERGAKRRPKRGSLNGRNAKRE